MFYIVFLLGLILIFISEKKAEYTNILFYIFLALLIILASLRYGLGADYFAYQLLYNRLNPNVIQEVLNGRDQQELLFRAIGSIIKATKASYYIYVGILSTINLIFLSLTCRKHSKRPLISLLIYFCFYYFVWTLSGFRQGLTLSLGIYYMLEYIEDQNNIKFTLIVIGLSLIHASAIILLPLVFLPLKINLNKQSLIVIILISFIISLVPIGNLVVKLDFIPFFKRISPYLRANASVMDAIDFQSFGRLIFLFIALFFYDSLTKEDTKLKKLVEIYIFSFVFYFLFKFSELTAARLSIYGKFLDILILPAIYCLFKDKIDKYVSLGALLLLCLLYFNKELVAVKKQTGLKTNNYLVPYVNLYNKNDYTFDNRYLKLLEKRK